MNTLSDYDAALSNIDESITAHREQIEKLYDLRRLILAKMQEVDMDAVLQCIVEKGLTSREVLHMINDAGPSHELRKLN